MLVTEKVGPAATAELVRRAKSAPAVLQFISKGDSPSGPRPNRARGSTEKASDDITLKVARLVALFCSLAAAAYAAVQTEPSPVVALFLSGGPLLAVILWLQKDARRTGVGAVQDWGYFLLLAWPVVIPWYSFRTRGRSGWRLMAGLFGLIGASYISWIVVASIVRITNQ